MLGFSPLAAKPLSAGPTPSGPPAVLSSPTYVPGSLTATTVKPRVTVNFP
jgi:hypothetical protein